MSSLPGPPPRSHKHERQYTPSTHSVIPTRRIWNDDYDGQMILGDLRGLKFPDICLTGEEKPRKTSPRKAVPTGDRTRARCVRSANATTCSTAVIEHLFQFSKCKSMISFLNCQLKLLAHISIICAHNNQIICQIWAVAGFVVMLHYAKTSRS